MTNNTWHSHLDETKRGLARLLARENLIVRHANVDTACFDLETRTLTLPKWSNITVDQYDLLIGHEVGHALYSDDVQAVKDAHAYPGLHTYINVLEDVRIERRIKDEFPGLRGSFARGYQDFFERGPIFQLDRPVGEYDFIDRINIHYKLGTHITVPFNDDERMILTRLDRCRTMQDIVALARELWNGQKKKDKEPSSQPGSDNKRQMSKSGSGSNMSDPHEEMSSENASDDKQTGSDGDTSDTPNEQSGDDSYDTEPDEASEASEESEADPTAETDKFNSDALRHLERERHNSIEQVLLAPLSDDVVTSLTVSNVQFVRDALTYLQVHPLRLAAATEYLDAFQSKYGPSIAHMAREFDRRKTAKLHERARTARTGRIDMTKLASYKFRDDIFQQVMVVPNGKSHGIVLLIDGSSSMTSVFSDVIEQVMLFTQFAKRVNIPVQAFMFHDLQEPEQREKLDSMPAFTARPTGVELVCLYDSTQKNHSQQQMVLAAVARMYSDAYHTPVLSVPHITLGYTPLKSGLLVIERHVAKLKQAFRLEKMNLIVLTDGDGNDAIVYNGINGGVKHDLYRSANIYRDTVSRHVYADMCEECDYDGKPIARRLPNADERMLVDSIRRRHDARVVRIHIAHRKEMSRAKQSNYGVWYLVRSSIFPNTEVNSENVVLTFGTNFVSTVQESIKDKEQFTFTGPKCYYDALIVVSSNALDLDEDDFENTKTQGWTTRKIASAFTKANVNAMKNRVFVNSIVPFLA